jgi:signal transduction histidine kinase
MLRLICSLMLLSLTNSLAEGEAGAVLTSIRDLRHLSTEAVMQAPRVRIRAIVTFHDALRRATFIHDGKDGIYVRLRGEAVPEGLAAGKEIEVEGVAGMGGFATEITGEDQISARARILGDAPLPEAKRVSAQQFMEPSLGSAWVLVDARVDDVVFKDGAWQFQARAGQHAFVGVAPNLAADDERIWQLVNHEVSMRGTVATVFNRHRQMTGRLFYVDSITPIDAEISRPTVNLPLLEPADLFRSDVLMPPSGVRVQGMVTAVRQGQGFFLKGARGALMVKTTRLSHLRAGSLVEVAGLPHLAAFAPTLQALQVEILRQNDPPIALPLAADTIEPGRHQHDFVELSGEFLGLFESYTSVLYQIRRGGIIFNARLDARANAGLRNLERGTLVKVQGILSGELEDVAATPQTGRRFEIWLPDASALTIVQVPSWWTLQRVLWVLAGVVGVAGLSFAWAVLLRRRVSAQTVVIREQAKRETNERERMRIAQNIHDDLGSRLTEIALLGARVQQTDTVVASTELGARIASLAKGTVATMDEIVWAVNPRYDTLQSLADYLCRLVPTVLSAGQVSCELDVAAVLPAQLISAEVRHGLVLALREALNNVLKHAAATRVVLTLTYTQDDLHISVADNGQGYDPERIPADRQGLASMKARLTEMGGKCTSTSKLGVGTTVEFHWRMNSAVSH